MASTKTDQTESNSKIIDGVYVGTPYSKGLERAKVTEIETRSFNIVGKLSSNTSSSLLPPIKRCNENLRRLNPVTSKPEYHFDQPKDVPTKGTPPKGHSATEKISSNEKGKCIIFVINYLL